MKRILLILLALFALAQHPAAADEIADTIAKLLDADPKPAIAALAAADDPKAKAVLAAIANGTLFKRLADDAVVIGEKDGEMYVVTNAATGEIEDMAAADALEALAFDDDAKAAVPKDLAAASADDAPLDFSGALAKLNGDSFADKAKAIDKLAELGDARAQPVLQALAEGRLFVRKSDGKIVIAERSGSQMQVTSPETGKVEGSVAPGDLESVGINNNLRNTVREAAGRLGLLSPDPAQRRRSADALLGGSAADSAAMLREAIEKEADKSVKAAMALALAAAEVTDADKAKRIAAVGILAGSSDLRVVSLLRARLAAETDDDVKKAVQAAVDRLQFNLGFITWAANVFQGISLGSVLLLAAIGLAITFGVMNVINMAHGEMIMLGAYSTFVVQELFRAFLPLAWFNAYLIVAVPVGFVVAALAGIALERSVIRWLYGRPLETLLATWGISLILQQVVRSIFGATNKEVANPSWMTGGFELIGGFTVTWNRLVIILFCFLILGLLSLLMSKSFFGLQMRAVTQNRGMASAMGIRTARVDALTFGLGSGIAGMAGVALSQIGNVSPNLGTIYIVDSFLVVVFGGVGNLLGTLVGSMTLGIANKLLEPLAGAMLAKIVILIAIILFIQKRPRGLFALKGRSVET